MKQILYEYESLILGGISIFLGAFSFFAFFEKHKKLKKISVIILMIITALTMASNVMYKKDLKNQCEVPNVTELSYSDARNLLRIRYLNEYPMTRSGKLLSCDENRIVVAQDPEAGKPAKKYSEVRLYFEEISNSTINEKVTPLSLTIDKDTFAVFTDGYYYEYPDPDNPNIKCFIDFQSGISGEFSYSRSLNDNEKMDWMHGGKLYDSDGTEVGEDGNYPSFWSNADGRFAVEFPENLKPGAYKYELYQFIGGQFISDSITFNYNG